MQQLLLRHELMQSFKGLGMEKKRPLQRYGNAPDGLSASALRFKNDLSALLNGFQHSNQMGQRDAASKLRIGLTTFNQLLRGRRLPTVNEVTKIDIGLSLNGSLKRRYSDCLKDKTSPSNLIQVQRMISKLSKEELRVVRLKVCREGKN